MGIIASFDFTGREMFLKSLLANKQNMEIIEQKTINEGLQRAMLEKMLPRCVVDQMQKSDFAKDFSLSKRHWGVSVMFCDIVGFTRFSSQVDPATVMTFLNELFTRFDQLCEAFSVYKVETVGDCYVAAVGVVTGVVSTHSVGEGETLSLSEEDEDDLAEKVKLKKKRREGAVQNTLCLVRFARAILEDTRHMVLPGLEDQHLELRVGIHTGECISGIVGRTSLRFSLFGEAVDGAEEMEESGSPGFIHVSSRVASLLPEQMWRCAFQSKSRNASAEETTSYLISL
jgi:class 3 adenylate cyclase